MRDVTPFLRPVSPTTAFNTTSCVPFGFPLAASPSDFPPLRISPFGFPKRWGVEVFFRSLKQTMSRGRMQSDAPDNGAAELDWSMMSIWMLGMVMLQQMQSVDRKAQDWSLAGGLRVIRRALTQDRQQRRAMRRFAEDLRCALKDQYVRVSSKTSRDYPRKKNEPPAGAPKVRTATKSEVKLAQRLRSELRAA